MRIFELYQDNQRFFAFEIENAYIRPKKIAKLVSAVDGVAEVKRCKWRDSSEIRVQFKYRGNDFIVWEPFGDNSRYWIGPKEEGKTVDISSLARVFKEYEPPLLIKIFGDLMTLNFKSLFRSL